MSLSTVSPRPQGALRVMTFNIQSCLRGIGQVAAVIRAARPDLVALQEVDRHTRRAGGLDQAEQLAQLTGLEHFAHFRATDLHGGSYGVALLSAYPLERVEQNRLIVPAGLEPRTVARAIVRIGGRETSVYVTHLSNLPTRSRLRARQVRQILRMMRADPRPKILLGDLNDGADSEAVTLLSRALADVFTQKGEGPAGTYPLPLFLPPLRLDYVFASEGLSPLRSFVLPSDASDHYPLIADFATGDHGGPGEMAARGGPSDGGTPGVPSFTSPK